MLPDRLTLLKSRWGMLFFTLQHPCCCTVKTAVPQLFMDLTVSITGKINSREIELESGVLFADKIVWRFPFGFALAKENHICVISRFLCYRTVWRSRVNRVRRRDMLINQIPPSLASIRFTAQAQLKYQFRMGRRVAQNPPSIRRASAEHLHIGRILDLWVEQKGFHSKRLSKRNTNRKKWAKRSQKRRVAHASFKWHRQLKLKSIFYIGKRWNRPRQRHLKHRRPRILNASRSSEKYQECARPSRWLIFPN